MRPKAIRTFELLYFGAISLYTANAVRDYELLKANAGEDLARRGLDPDTLLVTSILLVICLMLVLMFMVARLRLGFVRYLIVAFIAYEAWQLYPIVILDQGGSVIIGVASALAQAIAVLFAFSPSANRWFAGHGLEPPDQMPLSEQQKDRS